MTEQPNQDFDDLLRAAARDYNRPRETPRDRMWESIGAERARRTAVARPTPWRRFVLPAVAAAVLIAGIVIGRLYERMTAAHPASRMAKTAPSVVDSVKAAPDTLVTPRVEVATVPNDRPTTDRSTVHTPRTRPEPSRPPERPLVEGSANLALRLAVIEHLAGTEAMLTSFRNEAAHGQVDAQITVWARNLLTTTRLLQASAAQQDPTMKRLLDDLELVLVQIAQYSSAGAHHAEELELIEHSIERRGVIGKLHTTIPARLVPSGT